MKASKRRFSIKRKLYHFEIYFLYSLVILIGFTSCKRIQQIEKIKLKEGDILFQDLNCGELCDAIESVTQGYNNRDFSHCALIIKENGETKVIEAIGNKVQLNNLKDFLARSGDSTELKNISIGRIKRNYKSIIPEAVGFAKKQIGQPYDDEFILANGSWYCSELIYESFKKANKDKEIFELNPMTFKNPETKEFFPAWILYYATLQKDIPEGKAGINPGLISRSPNIRIITLK
jgi:hypothetical protein